MHVVCCVCVSCNCNCNGCQIRNIQCAPTLAPAQCRTQSRDRRQHYSSGAESRLVLKQKRDRVCGTTCTVSPCTVSRCLSAFACSLVSLWRLCLQSASAFVMTVRSAPVGTALVFLLNSIELNLNHLLGLPFCRPLHDDILVIPHAKTLDVHGLKVFLLAHCCFTTNMSTHSRQVSGTRTRTWKEYFLCITC